MKISLTILLLPLLIFMLLDNCLAQTSFNISNQTTGDTLFTIDNDGKVGIGTTNPLAKLEVLSLDPDQNSNFGQKRFHSFCKTNPDKIPHRGGYDHFRPLLQSPVI